MSIDVGGARMRLADSVSATALSVSPALRLAGTRTSLSASVTLARLDNATTHSGALDATASTPRRGVLSGDIEGIAGGSAHSDGTRTGQWVALARVNASTMGRGAWVGGGVGATWDGTWRSLIQGDVGAWLTRDAVTAALTVSPTIVDDSIRYTDVLVVAYHERGPWELNGSVGARGGGQLPNLPADKRIWGSASATRWLSPALGIVAGAGAYPIDFAQGFPGGEYLSLSVRWRPAIARPLSTSSRETHVVREFRTRQVGGDRVEISVHAPAAGTVEISGDFSGWAPIRLVGDERGWWRTTTVVPRGSHEVAVRVDGGPWTPPPGLTPLTDEFGGRSGLLVVPE